MKHLVVLIFSFLVFCNVAIANKIDSLLTVLANTDKNTSIKEKFDLHYQLARNYGDHRVEEYDKSKSHYTAALEIARELNDNFLIIDCYFGIGLSHQRMNEFQDALEYFNLILELDNTERENTKLQVAYTQLATIYQTEGDYDKAYEYQMEALFIAETKNDSIRIANSYYNIGTIFFYQEQFERALENYEKSKLIVEKVGYEYYIYSSLAAIGSTYDKLGNLEKSLEYNHRSLNLAKEIEYKTGISYSLGNIGGNYISQGKFDEAENFFLQSIELKTDLKDKWGIIGNQIDLSKLYLQMNKSNLAIPLLKEALNNSFIVNAKSRRSDIYAQLAATYDQLNQTGDAHKYLKKHIALKDSLLNEKTLEEMGQSKRRNEFRLKDHEIQILKKENLIYEQNAEIRKQQLYIFVITIVAFIMFIWWYKSKLKYQNKVNKLLEDKNNLLNIKNEEIHIKNKQLEHSNEDLQQFAYVASHDLKEPLRMINSYTNLLQRRYQESFDEAGKEFMHYIIDAVGRMGTLLDDLLDFSRAGTQPDPTTFIDTKDILTIAEANLRHRLETNNGKLVIKNPNLPMVRAHRTQYMQLLQNLISNGIKFRGERDPIVEVNGEQMESGYVISVKDNGIGISEENLEKVFEMFRRLHTRDEYEGTGIGLATCKRIVSTWGGDIWVESVEGEGSTFFFSIPNSAVSFPENQEKVAEPA